MTKSLGVGETKLNKKIVTLRLQETELHRLGPHLRLPGSEFDKNLVKFLCTLKLENLLHVLTSERKEPILMTPSGWCFVPSGSPCQPLLL